MGKECPVCQDTPSLVSYDANFGLVHKISSGVSTGLEARHKGPYFKTQRKFLDFVEDYAMDPKSIDCSNFQAGNVLRSKVKNSKLDITGVFGSICKHDIPLLFLNMTKGESLAYSAFLTEQFLKDRSEKLTVTYDIACSLASYLKKRNPDLLAKCNLAVPVFHSFAHTMSCQLNFGQRCVEFTGLCDGEGIERFWSFLRPFKKISKEMTVNNRNDLLTEALMYYSDKSIVKIGQKLKSKLEEAKQLNVKCSKELNTLLTCKNLDYFDIGT
ncbi:hypothetical protein SNE40_021070 [Patella caerulea]